MTKHPEHKRAVIYTTLGSIAVGCVAVPILLWALGGFLACLPIKYPELLDGFIYVSMWLPFVFGFFWVLTYPGLAALAYGLAIFQQEKREDFRFVLSKEMNIKTLFLTIASVLIGVSVFAEFAPCYNDLFFTITIGYWQYGRYGTPAVFGNIYFVLHALGTLGTIFTFFFALFARFGGKTRFSLPIALRVCFGYSLLLGFGAFMVPYTLPRNIAVGDGEIAPLVIGTMNFVAAALCGYVPETFRSKKIEKQDS